MTPTLGTLFGDRLTVYGDRAAWLAARQPPGAYALGATAVRAILGHGYEGEGPWTVWARCHAPHLVPVPTVDQQVDFDRGHDYEAVVRDRYAYRVPFAVESLLCIVCHPKHSWARCSPDALVADSDDGPGIVEVKTVRSWDDWGEDGAETRPGDPLAVPAKIACQCYWLLLVTGAPWCDVVACGPRWEERTVRLWADLAVQTDLLSHVAAWRYRHLVDAEQPPTDGSGVNRRWLASRYPEGHAPRAATTDEDAAVRDYARLGREIKRLEAARAVLAAQILASAGDAKALLLGDKARCAVVRAKGRRSIAVSAVERRPDLYRQLDEAGMIKTSDPTTHLRVYGFGDDEE